MGLARPFGFAGRRPVYPDSRAGLLALTGKDVFVSGGGLWPVQEPAAPLVDVSGNGFNMVEAGGGDPQYLVRNGRRVVRANNAAPTWLKASHAWPAANVSFAIVTISSFVNASAYSVMRLLNSSAGTEFIEIYFPDEQVGVFADDPGGYGTLIRPAVFPVKDTVPYWCGAQADFAGNKLRVLWCGRGATYKAEAALTGWDGITGGGANSFIGNNTAGGSTTWNCQFTGAQAEGATMLDTMAAAMGFA